MLVSAKEMIEKAHEGHYAIGAFNTNNLEWTKCILQAAEESKSPVIIQASEGAAKYMGGYKMVADMVKDLHDSMKITVPVALHLDHGTYDGAKACIEAGFTSVMFDGSHYPIEENVEKSKEIIELAHSKGVSVECEVGGIGGVEDGVASNGELADPKECALVAGLGVDFLACGIGNIHGKYPANWAGLNFERLDEINTAVEGKPLVLHGGSGIPFEQTSKAISPTLEGRRLICTACTVATPKPAKHANDHRASIRGYARTSLRTTRHCSTYTMPWTRFRR